MSFLEQVDWDFLTTIGWKALDWGVPFVLGVLFRKKVARFLITVKKLLFNDPTKISLLAVREYPPTTAKEVNPELFDAIRLKIGGMRLIDHNSQSMIISEPDFSTNLIFTIGSVDEEDIEQGKIDRLALRLENPLEVGARNIGKKVARFERIAEVIFENVEKLLFSQPAVMRKTYAVCDISRIAKFSEEQSFDLDDKNLNARVVGTRDQITITVSPIDKLSELAEKYRFA